MCNLLVLPGSERISELPRVTGQQVVQTQARTCMHSFPFFLNGSTVYILFYGCFLTTYLGGHFLSLYIELLHYFFRTLQYSIGWVNQNLISPLLPSRPSALNLGI